MEINYEFRNSIIRENSTLSYCYQCSTCSGVCPVALMTEGAFNPRKIIMKALLGMKESLVGDGSMNIWLCSTCQKCVELCPQKVDLTLIFSQIKNLGFNMGLSPKAFKSQAKLVMEHSVAIPYSKPILQRRAKMNLPEMKLAPQGEMQVLFEEAGLAEKLKDEEEAKL